jgi:FkbH-like protein
VPYTEAFFVALAAVVARRVAALRSSPYKAIAVDCDGTLWDGVCAEVGPRGVRLPPPFLEFQRFLVAQAERGVALCLCSKNEAGDVWEVFRHRPEMPLRRDHVAAARIGWGRKSEALRGLADELNLGLDAFVFLDDNPAERAEVRAHAPEVLTLELPPSPERRPSFLAGTWAFDRPVTTDADRRRGGFYREEGHRRRAREAAPSFQAFLDGLGLEVDVEPAAYGDLTRVEQLMQRTNQFNTTGLRLSMGELRSWACGAERWVHVVRARDRFGDYGLVGATLSERRGGDLHVSALMLSCRALGRGVEHRLLNALGAHAERVGADALELAFVPLARNTPARTFLQATAHARAADAFAISAAEAKKARLTADSSAPTEPSAPVATVLQEGSDGAGIDPTGNSRTRIDRAEEAQRLARLAMLWEDPLRVVDEELAHARRPSTMGPIEPPRTETERVLAGFWADVLRLREVGRSDDFFELGGDSISGTMLLGRIYDVFQVELTLPALFEAPTVAGLAHTISVHEVAHIDADELARELEALRGLTDAEVRALLAAE